MLPESLPRFIVDRMVGRLATWLRLLGYDTVSAGRLEDAQIARLAQQDDRIVLTRDRELARRKSIRTLLIDSEEIDEQLAQVVRAYGLALRGAAPRCGLCNGVLAALPKEQAAGQVPPYVSQTQERFLHCSSCGRIYWRGTHWQRMQERLALLAAGSDGGA